MTEEVRLAVGAAGEDLALRWEPPAPGRGGLLYMHGFGSSQAGEKAEFFAARARGAGLGFCSFDFRGHGGSAGGMGTLTLSRNLEDAAAVLGWVAGHCAGPLAFFGSSMGAATALWLAARRRGAVGRLRAGVAIAPALTLRRTLAESCGPEGLERWRRSGRLRLAAELATADLPWALMEDLDRHRVEELAALHRTPTLILQGMRDRSVPWRDVADFAAACRAAPVELVLFGDGDHRLLPHKARLWELAAGFLRRHGVA